jgi:hypothetical protein
MGRGSTSSGNPSTKSNAANTVRGSKVRSTATTMLPTPASEIRIVLGRSRRLLVEPWVQRAILVAAIVCVFWDGIWAGVARSDQIYYLHHTSQYHDLWDILSHAPSWNRITPDPHPDLILYRPVLYLLLGTFYYLFRYNFVGWQIAGLSLHIVVVLGLHLLLVQGRLQQTLFPLLIALLFGLAFFASELVLWNHIVGYVLFCALEVYAVYFFLRFLHSDRSAFLLACGLLSLIAEFTYEAGAIVNLLFATTLFGRGFFSPAKRTSLSPSRPRSDRWPALLFLLAALLLPIASLIDLRVRGFQLAPGGGDGTQTLKFLFLAAEDCILQIAFWLSTWLVPTVYHCSASGRAICALSSPSLTGLRMLNLIALALLAAGGIAGVRRLQCSGVSWRDALLVAAAPMVFLLGYSTIIAIGRSVPKGLMYALQANIYYSYIAYLTVCVAIAVATAHRRPSDASARGGADSDPAAAEASSSELARARQAGRWLILALAILVIANASGAHALARAYRYDYAAPRQEVIDRVLAWQRQVGDRTLRYFTIDPSCTGNETLWLDAPLLRKDSGWRAPVKLADALWPERSADLNAARIYIRRQSVDEIRCGEHVGGS